MRYLAVQFSRILATAAPLPQNYFNQLGEERRSTHSVLQLKIFYGRFPFAREKKLKLCLSRGSDDPNGGKVKIQADSFGEVMTNSAKTNDWARHGDSSSGANFSCYIAQYAQYDKDVFRTRSCVPSFDKDKEDGCRALAGNDAGRRPPKTDSSTLIFSCFFFRG